MTLKSYSLKNFTCDSCQGEFQNKIAYSHASNSSELDSGYRTYCSNCVKLNQLDKRSFKKSGRTKQFNTSVSEEWLFKLKALAFKNQLKYVELLEKALDCYEKHSKKSSKKN